MLFRNGSQVGYKMLVDYSETQDEMDKLAFTLDRNKFTRSSSFTAGQDAEPAEVKSQQPEPKDYKAVKAKSQSQRIKESIGTSSIHPSGSMSFSVNRSKIEPKKPSKKIGNLFSDAWKKGNEFDAKSIPEPISPDTPSGHSAGGATPNTLDPKPFTIENHVMQPLQEEAEEKEETPGPEPVEVVPQHNLVLDPPPLPRKSSSKRSRRTRSESPPPPPPSPPSEHRGVTGRDETPEQNNNTSSNSEQARKSSSPPPPPVPPKTSTPRTSSSYSDHSTAPRSSSSISDHEGFPRISSSTSDHEVFPRPSSNTSEHGVLPRPSSGTSDQEVFGDSLLPPPSRLLSTSMEEMPPPPPSADIQEDVDVELPPPPPEVLFKEKLGESLDSGRRRTTSGGSEPPAVPPKTGRPRFGSSGTPGPPTKPKTSSFTGSPR
ncbi:hypothetical protein ACROYT_G025293 [Oculina patagonica]